MILSITLALILCVALVFVFAFCGKKNDTASTATAPAPTKTTAPETVILEARYVDLGANMAWWYNHDTPRKTKGRELHDPMVVPDPPRAKYVKHVAGFNKSQWHRQRYAGWAPGRTAVNNDGGRSKIAPKNRIEETHYGFTHQDRLRVDRRRERKNRDAYRGSCYEEWI